MIQSIKIKNFQSHKSTQLKLDPGLNSIIGSSDTGKSSVLRALFWAIENRPLGTGFISHWALNEKGKQTDSTSVMVISNKKKVKRIRDKDINAYEINGKTLEAIGTDVPPEVTNAFNLTEVNVQKQMDSPFLLSESAGEVARFFNKIIRLDIIDSFLTIVESKKRQTKVQKGKAISDRVKTEKELEKLDWIDAADRLILKAERVGDKIEKIRSLQENLTDSIEEYEEYQAELLSIPDIDKTEKLLSECVSIQSLVEKKESVLSQLELSVERWTEAFEQSEKELPNLERAQELIGRYELLQPKREALEDDKDELCNTIQKWDILQKQTASASTEIARLEKQLPERCPTCGQLLKGSKKL